MQLSAELSYCKIFIGVVINYSQSRYSGVEHIDSESVGQIPEFAVRLEFIKFRYDYLHVAMIQIFGTLISFQLKDNGKLPNYSNYPIINEHQGEDNRQYDLIGFYGHSVIKDIIMTHPADSKCGIYFEENTPSYTVKVNYNYNFCGKRSCFKITPVSELNRKVEK